MNIWFTASEATPFFKAGGLADVAGALPEALEREGINVKVILPFYASMPQQYKEKVKDGGSFIVKVGWRNQYCGLKTLTKDGIEYVFIDNEGYFGRPELYGYEDDGERFAFFSQAVIECTNHLHEYPDIIHCNDWHTAIIPVLLKEKYGWIEELQSTHTVLTIHNLLFQGVFDPYVLSDWYGIGFNAFQAKGLEFYNKVNIMKGALYAADLVTTVSPTYAKEIMQPEFGYGLETVLQDISGKVVGILNGFDVEAYNSETTRAIQYPYSLDSLDEKNKNKQFLQKRCGLREDDSIFMLGMVSRLTDQKGVQLFQPILSQLVERNIQLVLLGTGEPYYEQQFAQAAEQYSDKVCSIIDFDQDLAQQIYAGVDLFLMPSQFEPCGLAQMNAMRYGTVPLVHETGGLVDTVVPYNDFTGEGNGFSFHEFTPEVFLNTIDHASDIFWNHPKEWRQLMESGMKRDFSWTNSAQTYIRSYRNVLTQNS